MKRSMVACLAAAAIVAVSSKSAGAQRAPGASSDYPAKPVRIIVPQAAGGGVDVVARNLAQLAAFLKSESEKWGRVVRQAGLQYSQ